MIYNLAIIGGGPAGYSAALEAIRYGLTVILFEKDLIGGTCLNRGCVPTKSLIHAATIYADFKKADRYGIHADQVKCDYSEVIKRNQQIIKQLRDGLETQMKDNGIRLMYGEARLIKRNQISCNGETFEAENVLISTGSSAGNLFHDISISTDKQRLAIARAILAKPELLILDEPINALDPEGIKEMRLLFGQLRQDYGTTIFISSHILSEVEQIADRIGVIAGGKLLKEISVHDIHEYQAEYVEINTDNVKQAACLLEQDKRLSHFDVVDDTIIRIYSTVVSGKEISALLVKNGVGLESIGRKENSLEDYFFQLTEEGK